MKQFFKFLYKQNLDTNIKVFTCVGETPMPNSTVQCDICVATMGRLKHLIEIKLVSFK